MMIDTLTPAVVQSDRARRARKGECTPDRRGRAGDLFGALRRHVFRPRTLLGVVAALIEGATIYLPAAAVAAPVSALGSLVAGLVASLLSNEPFTPGGLGATEAGIVLVLTGLGVSPDTAAAVAVLNRVVNYLSLAIVGPLLYLAPRLSQGIVRRGPAVSDGGLT